MVKVLRPLPEPMAGVGVLVLGLMWSLGIALAEWEQLRATAVPLPSAFALVAVGGTLTIAGGWFGIGAVTWAMARLLGGKARLFKVLFSLSAAAPPLWVAAPVAALALAGAGSIGLQLMLLVIAGVGGLGFLQLLIGRLQEVESFSWRRALGCLALTVVFCGSFLSLHHG